jgi:uncharacterized membrane protein YgdD (TMEM256/DUF423 family)
MTPSAVAALGAFHGAIAVAMGAFGAHAMAGRLSPERLEVWRTAAHYQLVHAVAIVALVALVSIVGETAVERVGLLWFGGALVFSGSLYALCLTGVGVLGAVTPIGGAALIAGWSLLVWYAVTAGSAG